MQNSRSTFSLLFYINTSKKKKSGKCPILGRISVDGENTAFSTGLEILPVEWDSASGLVNGKSGDSAAINAQIENIRAEIMGYYRAMLDDYGFITAELLKNAVKGIGVRQNTVMQEFASLLDEKRKSIGIRIKENTYTIYPLAFSHFRNFLSSRYGVEDIPFGKVDIAMVEAYACYLRIDLHLSPRTVKSNMIPFRTAVTRAYNRGLIRQDPFFGYVPEKVFSKRRWLSGDEIERLINADITYPTRSFTRDMFIFSTFTGLSHIDLANLKHSEIQRREDGSRWIVVKRRKTGTDAYIPLLDIPCKILEKYRNTRFSGTDGNVFKLQTRVAVNLQLKRIAQAARVDKRLTFHMSRHSFATSVCLTNGVPIESLSQMMGHLSIKTTQIYAEVTRTKLNGDMTNLAERIKGKYELADMGSNTKSNNN
jgi:site-specific recombinase XerD